MQEQRLFVSNNPLPNKDTNIQTNRQNDLFPLHFTPILLRHFTVTFAIEKVFCFIIKTQ